MHTMQEPARSLLLHALRVAGTCEPICVLRVIEQQISDAEYDEMRMFLTWVHASNLKVDQDDIDVRFNEYRERLAENTKQR